MIIRPTRKPNTWRRWRRARSPLSASSIPIATSCKRETMSSTADDTAGPRVRVGGWRSLLGRFGLTSGRDRDAPEASAESRAGAELMSQAQAFQTLRVGDVMTPRADIRAVELAADLGALVAAFAESEHSRLPVYRGSLDDPVGFAHIKDVFRLLARPAIGKTASGAVLLRLKRETLYVPPSMRAADLLVRMRLACIRTS